MWQKMFQIGSGGTPEPELLELVPYMTSNTLPEGEAISSTPSTATYDAFQAFSDDFTIVNGRGFLASKSATNTEVGYKFTNLKTVKKVGVHCFAPNLAIVTASNQTYKIYGLSAGVWEAIDNQDYTCPANSVVYHELNTNKKYSGIKIVFSTILNVDGNVKYTLVRAQFYGY